MRTIDKYTLISIACIRMLAASKRGIWNGKDRDEYFESCRWMIEGPPCVCIFTRESGYHSGGWWKNPLYERCYHLSISFPGGIDKRILDKVIKGLFGTYEKWIWTESPHSDTGKKLGVWHYRLFCDENWNPIMPKGEVYSTQFTERGWKSFSELNSSKS